MTTRIGYPPAGSFTTIARRYDRGDELVGFITGAGTIYQLRGQEGVAIGRIDGRRVLRFTHHDERELGTFTAEGRIRSHGLFEGGDLGWLDPDGTVIQAGLIFGEQEVGAVAGSDAAAAAAALLLIFLPEEQETQRRMERS